MVCKHTRGNPVGDSVKAFNKNLPYDPLRNFTINAHVVDFPLLPVPPSLPVKNVREVAKSAGIVAD